MSNAAKKDILATSLSVLIILMILTKLFPDLYLAKFLRYFRKLFFLCNN